MAVSTPRQAYSRIAKFPLLLSGRPFLQAVYHACFLSPAHAFLPTVVPPLTLTPNASTHATTPLHTIIPNLLPPLCCVLVSALHTQGYLCLTSLADKRGRLHLQLGRGRGNKYDAKLAQFVELRARPTETPWLFQFAINLLENRVPRRC
jgi:hypothetical protein